jgi:protein TonB
MHRPTTASGAAFGGPVAVSLCLHLALAGALLDLVGATTTPVPAPAVIATPFTVVPYVAVRAASATVAEPAKAVPIVEPVQPLRAPVAQALRAPSPVRPSLVPAPPSPEVPQATPPRPETVAPRRGAPDAAAPSLEAIAATELPERRKTPPPPTPAGRPAAAVASGPTGDPTAPPVDGQAASAVPIAQTAVASGPTGDVARPVAAAGNPVPAYPRQARLKGWEGTVVLAVTVGPDGRCRSLAVASSSGFAVLDRAALAAVRHWRFEPARRNGLAVEAVAEVPVTFRLT